MVIDVDLHHPPRNESEQSYQSRLWDKLDSLFKAAKPNPSHSIDMYGPSSQESCFVYEGQTKIYKSEINHNVTFREGLTLKNEETYTPRLIAIDLPDSINNLKLEGTLYDIEPEGDIVSWSHEVTIHKQEQSYKKNEFRKDLDAMDGLTGEENLEGCNSKEEMEVDESEQVAAKAVAEDPSNKLYNLDDSVRSWSDYLKIHLHPRSLSVVKKFYHSDNSFNVHGLGVNTYNSESRHVRSEIEDRVHFFTEEADHLQGFHFLADIYDGFGGLTSALSSDIADDFSKKGRICFCPFQSVRNTQDNNQSLHDLINTVLSVVKLHRLEFTVVPLSLVSNPWVSAHASHKQIPGVAYKKQLAYHTSAIFAAALDCATLGQRLINNPLPLGHVTDTLSAGGRTISNLSVAMPVPLEYDVRSPTDAFAACCDPFTSLTPLYDVNSSRGSMVQYLALRGAKVKHSSPFHENMNKWITSDPSSFIDVAQPCNVKAPYPHIFEGGMDKFGCQCAELRSKTPAIAVESVPSLTSLSTSDHSKQMLSHLLERSNKLSQRHLHKHTEAGLELDDWTETINDLNGLVQRYGHDTIDADGSDDE